MEKLYRQVLEEAGIKPALFHKYQRLSLLPGPTRVEVYPGRGSVAYYSGDTLHRILWIKDLQKADKWIDKKPMRLGEIKAILGPLQDATPEEEVLIPVDSKHINSALEAFVTLYQRLNLDIPPGEAPRVMMEHVERDGRLYLRLIGVLFGPRPPDRRGSRVHPWRACAVKRGRA